MLHKNAKKVISGVLGTCLVLQLAALPSLAQTSNVPDQTQTAVTAQENSGVQTLASTSFTDVLLSVGANNTQMNATWYAAQEGAGYVLVAKQSQLVNGAMPENAAKFDATSTPANESGKWSNQATITGLEPGTVYAYQLVNGEEKSDVATFTTATNGAFSSPSPVTPRSAPAATPATTPRAGTRLWASSPTAPSLTGWTSSSPPVTR